jgi:hypothetical protein
MEAKSIGAGQTNVEALCEIAGLTYGVLNGPVRDVYLVLSGGHRKVERSDWRKGDIFIDLSLIDYFPTIQAKARCILQIAAVELNCYEAGETLSQEGLVNSERNGQYTYLGTTFDRNA